MKKKLTFFQNISSLILTAYQICTQKQSNVWNRNTVPIKPNEKVNAGDPLGFKPELALVPTIYPILIYILWLKHV